MKRIPWISGLTLSIVLVWVVFLTQPVKATAPCFSSCSVEQAWASQMRLKGFLAFSYPE